MTRAAASAARRPASRALCALRAERGQTAVEAALIMPLMVFLILGIIQLTMMQQARLMLEYAAFNAARAGIVWNADKEMMTNAATLSLLPTLNSCDTLMGTSQPFGRHRPGFLETWIKIAAITKATNFIDDQVASAERTLSAAIPLININGLAPDVGLIEVEALNPHREDLPRAEVDFDDIAHPNGAIAKKARDLNRLTVGVRLLYPMKIPFANWIIHESWLAAVGGVQLTGPLWASKTSTGASGGARAAAVHSAAESAYSGGGLSAVANFVLAGKLRREIGLISMAGRQGVYLMPLRTSYSMHMMSNVYQKNLEASPGVLIFDNPFN